MTETAPFATACGQLRPLRLAVEHADGGRIADGELDQPHALIGSGAGCEIALNAPDVPERVACLQVLDGEAFVVELAGFAVHRLTPESPFAVGPFTIRLFDPPADGPVARAGDPLRDRVSDREFSRFELEHSADSDRPATLVIDRRLTFLGIWRDPRAVEVADPGAYLTLTRDGLFVTDLLTPAGTRVNGAPVRTACLADGDELSVGRDRYVVRVGKSDAAWERPAAASRMSEALLGGIPIGGEPEEQLVPLVPTPARSLTITPPTLDPDLVAILKQVGGLQNQLIDQFRRTVDDMLADFDSLEREQLVALRDEMARMGEVTAQLARVRDQAGVTVLPPLPVGGPSIPVPVADAPPVSEETAAVHLAVYDRLAGLERDRPGLWKRLRGLLGG